MKRSGRPDIEPLRAGLRLQFNTEEELDLLRAATLWVLENVGVRFPSQTALELLEANGASVDFKSHVVRFPPGLVLSAMASVPRYFLLGARDAAFDLQLQDGVTYVCNDGCGSLVLDMDGRLRPSTKADVAASARVCDYLSAVSFLWPMVAAQDCGPAAPLHEIEALWANSVKHVQGSFAAPEPPAPQSTWRLSLREVSEDVVTAAVVRHALHCRAPDAGSGSRGGGSGVRNRWCSRRLYLHAHSRNDRAGDNGGHVRSRRR